MRIIFYLIRILTDCNSRQITQSKFEFSEIENNWKHNIDIH